MSISVTPFTKWNLQQAIYGDPILTTAERYTAEQLLKSLDDKFRPVKSHLHSQTLIGWRIGCWRSTVCRALRKLTTLGYFRTTWVSVPRQTRQGIKGVTRVMVSLGPVLLALVNQGKNEGASVSAGQPRGVTQHHPTQTRPVSPGALCADVDAKSADRTDSGAVDNSESRRKALAEWPRLAGTKPSNPPVPIPARLLNDPEWYAEHIAALDARILAKRNQPRRRGR